MKPGQHIGPFTIEREIGAGAMGAVYRGVYPKTGQQVAIKVMLPGVAENKQSADRFQREVSILKQLNHPHIVRLLGDGTHEGMRFYAMEYIQGESLDRALSRRGRFSWEEVVTLGRQLCDALQHAHDKGVVHRDLKPSNLMVEADGTLKLTDFGIAKDLDVTQLTEAHCTVGTASYMSPEQCRGERNLTHKSDLYSLGIVFYELLTGKKPFYAENVMEMFTQHVKGTFERPARVIVDIPKWLDILVCQLLEKKPEQRPRDAVTVGEALEQVLEKVEARQSAGLEAAQGKGGRVRGTADRDAASALAGKKKKKKKPPSVSWYQRTWLKAVGLLIPLVAIGLVLWLLLRPPSADTLYMRIEKLMASEDPKKMKRAYEGPIRDYRKRFGHLGDERTRQVIAWGDQVELQAAEDDLAKTVENTKTIKLEKMDALTEANRLAVKAVQAENEGDLAGAERLWQQIIDEHATAFGSWEKLARRRVEQQLRKARTLLAETRKEPLELLNERAEEPRIDSELARKVFAAWRYEEVGDVFEARSRWEDLARDVQEKSEQRPWYLLAREQARRLEKLLRGMAGEKQPRLDVVRQYLEKAEQQRKAGNLRPAEVMCLHVAALYGDSDDKDFAELATKARALFDRIQKDRKGN